MPEEMMCCGTASLKDVDKGELSLSGGGKTPRKGKKPAAPAKEKKAPEVAKAKKKKNKNGAGKKENPYASLGLDKFTTVRAELETRREKVLRRVDGGGDRERVMVRFVQSGAKGWVPIVVKLPPAEDQAAKGKPKKKCMFKAASPPPSQPSTPQSTECAWPREDVKRAARGEPKKKCKLESAVSPPPSQPSTPRSMECAWPKEDVKRVRVTVAAKATAVAAAPAKKKTPAAAVGRWSLWGKKVTRPSQYWPFVAVLLLVSLVVFGRVFAICCTSVWWYLVPIFSGGEEGQSGKKSTDKKIGGKLTWSSLPPSHGKKNSSGAHEVISPRSHADGKKR